MLPWDCCLCVSKTLINKSLENKKKSTLAARKSSSLTEKTGTMLSKI